MYSNVLATVWSSNVLLNWQREFLQFSLAFGGWYESVLSLLLVLPCHPCIILQILSMHLLPPQALLGVGWCRSGLLGLLELPF